MQSNQLRILHLEDNELDAELLATTLSDSGIEAEIRRVGAQKEFETALSSGDFDLIISDFSIPSWNGKAALRLARERYPLTPFIFVSGTIGEGAAVESLRNGATDYVLKHEFSKLVPAVRRAQREANERRLRRKAELELAQTTKQLQNLFNNLDDVFLLVDATAGQLLQLSPASEQLCGWQPSAFFENPELWKECVLPEDRDLVAGKQIEISDGQSVRFEFRIRHRDGSTRWIDARLKPVIEPDEHRRHVDGVLRDITDRKQTEDEKRRIEQQLLRNQRMESVGTLAGGVAHDLNNILSPILMVAELLKEKLTDPHQLSLLETLELSAKRGAGIVRQVLTFARGTQGERIALQPRHLLQNMNKMLRETFPKSIHLDTEIPKDLWMVLGDATQIDQVLLNLCVNARDAMPAGGRIKISAQNVILDEQFARFNIDSKAGPYVVLEVADTGMGIAPDIVEKIFEPFFTTKEIGRGTGLGLSTVRAIVKSHGGFIHVYSEVGRGTQFKIYLPATLPDLAAEQRKQDSALPRGNGELILVVDDETSIRDMTKLTLELFDYGVITAANGAEAVAHYARRSADVAVVLLDMMMPVMDGQATIRALEAITSGVKIIATSGLVDNAKYASAHAGTPSVVRSVLAKPFSAAQLLTVLHKVVTQA